MKRRDFLKGALALGALSGCSFPAARPIQGRIVGASFQDGHRLRGGSFPTPSRTVKTKVAILGGGIAGLSAGWKLARSGLDDFRLFELEAAVGGNSRGHDYPESPAPWAAHYLPVPTRESRAVRELLTEMKLMLGTDAAGAPIYDEVHLCHAPEERLFYQGRWEEGLYPHAGATFDDARQLEEFQREIAMWKARRDSKGRKAFALPLALSSPEWAALDQQSMASFMDEKKWTSPRLRWFVEYGCRDDYGTSLARTSAWAGLHYFAARDGGGYDPPDAEFVWPEGNAHLSRYLHGVLGERCATRSLVYRVGDHALVLDLVSGQSLKVEAERFIYALPTFTRPYLLGDKRRGQFEYAPWVVANLVMDGPPPESPRARPLAWDNVIYDSPSLGYVVATHQNLTTVPGPTVLTWYYPCPGDDPAAERKRLLERSWESWRDQIVGELARVHGPGVAALIREIDVMLLGHAMISPRVDFMFSPERTAAALSRGRLHFAHSDLSGISIFEEAQYHGVRAAQEAMAALGHPYAESL